MGNSWERRTVSHGRDVSLSVSVLNWFTSLECVVFKHVTANVFLAFFKCFRWVLVIVCRTMNNGVIFHLNMCLVLLHQIKTKKHWISASRLFWLLLSWCNFALCLQLLVMSCGGLDLEKLSNQFKEEVNACLKRLIRVTPHTKRGQRQKQHSLYVW